MSKALKLKKSYTLNDNNIAICKNKTTLLSKILIYNTKRQRSLDLGLDHSQKYGGFKMVNIILTPLFIARSPVVNLIKRKA
jgi:hypothetical protein